MTLVEKILKALDASDNNETKLSAIKALALEEIRLQALKTTPGKTKLSATLTRMYKETMKSDLAACMTKRKGCKKSDCDNVMFYDRETLVVGFLVAIGISAGLWILLTILGNVCLMIGGLA